MAETKGNVALTLLATSFGFSLVQLDVTIVNVALPQMATSLGAHIAALQWVVDAYALCFAALLLSAGFFGDRFGARKVYLGGLAVFGVASLACGLAPNALALSLARAVQGLGAAAMLPCSLAILNHVTGHDDKLRAKSVGWWTASGSITIAAGPILGGLLLSFAGWRSIFLVNLPLCILAAWLTLRIDETETKQVTRSFDLFGRALSILALAGITAAVIEARPLGVTHGLVTGAAVIGLAAAGGFIAVEARSSHPMLPLSLFRQPGFSAAVVYGVIANMTYYGVLFVLSLYLQRVLGYSPLMTGLAYLPLTAMFFAVNIFSGWWVGHAGSRIPMVIGALIDAAGFALLLLLGAASPYSLMLLPFALMPTGMGLGVPAMTTSVLAAVDKQVSGVAAGVLNAARQAGGAIGIALFGALAGDSRSRIVAGLHTSALIAVGLLLLAAVLAFFAIRSKETVRAKPAA
jgi:DHA2 family methylenomycin A resistance protein-like MFS transporter